MPIGTSDGQNFDSDWHYEIEKAQPSTPSLDADYQNWVKSNHLTPTDDYDLRGAYDAGTQPDQRGHLPDTFKLPNHITFSDESQFNGKDGNEGGHWEQDSQGKWSFTPGPTNLKNHTVEELQDYFKKYEPDATLNLPKPKTVNTQNLDDQWATATTDSAGDLQFYKYLYNDMKARPELYQQRIENLHSQSDHATIKQRYSAVVNLIGDIHDGKKVTTAQMVDAFNGMLDHVQGINALKGLLGFSTNAPASEGSAGDLSYLLPPGET